MWKTTQSGLKTPMTLPIVSEVEPKTTLKFQPGRADPLVDRPAAELLYSTCTSRALAPIADRFLRVGPYDRIIDKLADGDGPST